MTRMRGGRTESGFTLVELMVVLVILGLAATAVVLAMPEAGGSLQAEAERFAARAKAARDAAIVEARPIALHVDTGGYAIFRRSGGEWRPGARHEWAEGTQVEARGVSAGGTRFDSTGLADPISLTLRRRGREVAVDIGQDGSVHVRR
jgi:general secretion pathway protein H